jgi:hypothetical protein
MLFGDACGFKSHKLLNNSRDIAFQMQPTAWPFALGDATDRIVLHGIHLFEQIDQEKGWTDKFARDCGGCLRDGGIAVGVRGRNKHFQAYTLDVLAERPIMSWRCSMGWKVDADTQGNVNRVVKGLRDDDKLTVEIERVAVPGQLTNECASRALGDVFELALRMSYGHEGLERDLQYSKRGQKKVIEQQTNVQGERLRMFMQLSIFLGMSMIQTPSSLYPDFMSALNVAKSTVRGDACKRPCGGGGAVDLLPPSPATAAGAGAAGGRGARRQVLHHPQHIHIHYFLLQMKQLYLAPYADDRRTIMHCFRRAAGTVRHPNET